MTDDNVHGMSRQPNLDDPAQVYVHRAIEALKAEFGNDDQVPRFAVVCELPPEGRIAIASTGDDAVDIHRMLALGAGSVRRAMSSQDKQRARQLWDAMRAGFDRRN